MEKIEQMSTADTGAEQQKQEQISNLGSLLHDEWREPRKQEDGSYEPRLKKTKDQEWIDKHGTDEIDIANASYEELPEDWKGENKYSAEEAMNKIYEVVSQQKELNDDFIEEASIAIHNSWMDRRKAEGYDENDSNWEWAKSIMIDYNELPEEEKDKDRAIVKKAIEIFNSGQ